MSTPMEAYNQLILQEMHSDSGMGVHKVSEKTNHRWKDGFLAGYAAGQREALLEAMTVANETAQKLGFDQPTAIMYEVVLSKMVKELE